MMKKRKIRIVWTTVSCLLAVLFSCYVLLDTFLLSRKYQTAAEANLSMFSSESGQTLRSQSTQSAQGSETPSSTKTQNLPTDVENVGTPPILLQHRFFVASCLFLTLSSCVSKGASLAVQYQLTSIRLLSPPTPILSSSATP